MKQKKEFAGVKIFFCLKMQIAAEGSGYILSPATGTAFFFGIKTG